jgi:aminomethyltransferase
MVKRFSALSDTFKSFGAEMTEVFGMETPASFGTNPDDEHNAIREAIGMWDSSVVNKIRLRGKDALEVLNTVSASNIHKIPVGRGAMGIILNEEGGVDDDALVLRLDDNHYMISIGEGDALEELNAVGKGKNVSIEYDDDTHIISVQGPKAIELLNNHCDDNLKQLKFFDLIQTQLFGQKLSISRTGFSGERGYEIVLPAKNTVSVYTQLLEFGEPIGLMQCAFDSINKARLEAGLVIGGLDFDKENTPWEIRYGWLVSKEKEKFLGKEAVMASKGKEKVFLKGIVAEHDDAVEWGAPVEVEGQQVGVVTSSCYSRRMRKSIALVKVIPSAAKTGTKLTVKGENISCKAEVVTVPIYDPEKKRMRAN